MRVIVSLISSGLCRGPNDFVAPAHNSSATLLVDQTGVLDNDASAWCSCEGDRCPQFSYWSVFIAPTPPLLCVGGTVHDVCARRKQA